ncbi:MAG: amino acid permease [Nitrososphaerales archaeon]|nr:amino acid permease [Nitrososphaerales archaeon]
MPDDRQKDGPTGLRKVITLRHAVAIYVSSVLGAGILVIPGLAARTAGPASLLAWALLSLASYPFAYTFATLSARRPDSGGVYSFARESFGPGVSTMTAWLFVAWVVMGAPAITLAAGSYLAFAFPMPREWVFAAAAIILLMAYAVNLFGIRLSGRVQVAMVTTIVLMLAFAVAASIPRIEAKNFVPVLPNGLASVGVASALIVWSYLGYENVSNVAEEFENPKRDFGRSVTFSVLLIGALYLAVAFAIVGTGAYTAGGGVTPFAELMSNVFGSYGGLAVSLLAVVVIFSTVNAYTVGMARVVYAAARDGSLPGALATVDPRTGVPRRALAALLAMIVLSLAVFYFMRFDIQSAFLATSGAAVLVYVVGSAAGIKLLKERGAKRVLPWVSLAVSIALLPFIGTLLAASAAVAS